jgi:PII-like signaling protein
MLPKGKAKKVTIYLNVDTRHHLEALWRTIFNFLKKKHVAGASVSHLLMGFGSHQEIHDASSEYTGHHLPVKIEFIDTPEKVDELLPSLYDMVTDGLIEVQDTTVVKSVRKDRPPAPSAEVVKTKTVAAAKMIRIYLGESDKYNGEPLYDVIVKKLRMMGISGATVYRGILGYGAKKQAHKEGLLHISHDLPIQISIAETTERVDELLNVVSGLMQDGLIVVSDVELHRVVRQIPRIGGDETNAERTSG